MYKVLLIIIVILAVFLCFIVTIQNSKGGGLAAGFSSSNQIMGVRKTTDILEKTTWTLISCIVVLSILTAYIAKPKVAASGSVFKDDAIENVMTNPESSTTTFESPVEIEDLPQE
ncbi:MAG: preprotein translocase subunit SecG [Bacteroidaceae bacterium]|nr:preprotein translocase subunit SecG [Candidatus Colenecus caballi]MCQ2071672.1 preprotein translocase subunit SecG [Bacteroidaceae bacterium]